LSRGDADTTLGNDLPSRTASPEQTAISSEREGRIMMALGEIKAEYRVALILREIEELSYEEIAETLGISIGTVKSRIARGREELRRRVKDLI
ncbi:MAG: sigma-70 family RNA polymerase sigma factor, partial [Acidobacteriota bacterium]